MAGERPYLSHEPRATTIGASRARFLVAVPTLVGTAASAPEPVKMTRYRPRYFVLARGLVACEFLRKSADTFGTFVSFTDPHPAGGADR